MNKTPSQTKWMTVCVVALLAVATMTAQAAQERMAKVVRIKGSARASTGNNVWQPIKVGDTLGSGMIIQTAASSAVDIVFAEALDAAPKTSTSDYASFSPTVQRDIIRVQPDTVIAIEKLSATDAGGETVTETQLDLRSGRIIGSVNKVSAASTFEIKIPNGVAGIRGTLFSISALGVISVISGSVAAATPTPNGPKVEVVQAGFEYDIPTGKISPIPVTAQNDWERDMPHDRGHRIIIPGDHTNNYCSPNTGGHKGGSNDGDQGHGEQ
jgi:hypothetical protein